MTWNLPNVITTSRLLLAPVFFFLLFQPDFSGRMAAFLVFVVAAVSDLWDGYLARRRGEITDYGKLVDPLADKLLLAAGLIPFYLLTPGDPVLGGLPLYDGIALWIVLVLLGREVVVTGLRMVAARRGQVIAARTAGKHKAFVQSIFVGAMALWMALRTGAVERGWGGGFWEGWVAFHGWFVTVTLTLALVLTIYSLILYLLSFSEEAAGPEGGAGRRGGGAPGAAPDAASDRDLG